MSLECGDSNIKKSYIIQTTESADIFSACTELYTNQILPCSGDTIIFNGNAYVLGNVSGTTYYGDGSNLTGIITQNTFVTGATFSGGTLILTRNDNENIFATFTGNTSGECITNLHVTNIFGCSPIVFHSDLEPVSDATINFGTPIKRFRDINTVSGTSTVWSSTTRVITPELDLGLDTGGNTRIITADNSIIQNDILLGGTY